jgi:NAD(P)-dependent dehydrogenase (short-subunit alcohol dehydrogenase family)
LTEIRLNEGSVAGPPVAVVTGGGSGIGRAICQVFAEAGFIAVVADCDRDRAQEVAGEIEASDGRAIAIAGDVSVPDSANRIVSDAVGALGRLDVLVNCAGLNTVGHLLDVTQDVWRRVFAVNVEGALLMTQAAAPVMASQAPCTRIGCRGKILNVSSAAGEVGRPLMAAYGASKAALNHLSRTCAVVLAESDISTTFIYPGDVADGMWGTLPEQLGVVEKVTAAAIVESRLAASPLGRFQTAREVADLVLFVATSHGMSLNGKTLWTIPHLYPL